MSKTNGTKPSRMCGDYGGTNYRGEPCQRPAHGGRCGYHAEEAEEVKQEVKEVFLVAASDAFRTLTEAASIAGRDYSTIFRWRQEDPEFDKAVKKILADLDRARTQAAKDHLFRRIMEGEATSTEVLFYLSNMSDEFNQNGNVGHPAVTPEDRAAEQLSAREKLRTSLEGMRERLRSGDDQVSLAQVTGGPTTS